MDGRAYMDDTSWGSLLTTKNITDASASTAISDTRYNAIFHLVSASIGAESYYTCENNSARSESLEEARLVDEKSQAAWMGHPHHYVFGNLETNFEGKLRNLIDTAAQLVGLPSFEKTTCKFLLKEVPTTETWEASKVDYKIFDIEKVYLYDRQRSCSYSGSIEPHSPKNATNSPPKFKRSPSFVTDNNNDNAPLIVEEYSFVRRRTARPSNVSSYGQTTVQRTSDGQEIEIKRIISEREYRLCCKNRDLGRHVVRQQRISFIWREQSFNCHIYNSPITGLCILHCQSSATSTPHPKYSGVRIPPFLKVERELDMKDKTNGDATMYGAHGISLKQKNGHGSGAGEALRIVVGGGGEMLEVVTTPTTKGRKGVGGVIEKNLD